MTKSTRGQRRQERFLFVMMGVILLGLFISGYFLFVDKLLPSLMGEGGKGAAPAAGKPQTAGTLAIGAEANNPSENPLIEQGKTVTLYFAGKRKEELVRELRKIPDETQPLKLAKALITELLRGPFATDARAVIPPGTQLRALYYSRGVFTVDFSDALVNGHPGGIMEEMLTVYSIVNTLTELDVKAKVQVLVNGREVTTLKGNAGLSQLLVRDDALIAK